MRNMSKRTAALLMAAAILTAGAPALPEPAQVVNAEPAQSATAEAAQSATAAPAQSATAEPAQSATLEPAQSATAEPTQTANVAPAQSATAEPTQTANAKPTQSATLEPAQTATVEPAPGATIEPAQTETAEPAPGATAEPAQSANPSPAASAEATPGMGEATPAPSAGPAWFWDGDMKRYGEVEELLFETREIIHLTTDALFVFTGEAAQLARAARFALDPEAFPDAAEYQIHLSELGPNGEAQEGAIYLWIARAGAEATPGAGAEPTPEPAIEAELLVVPEMYRAGAWSNIAPSFALSAVPDALEGYSFAASLDDGELQAAESPYALAEPGKHEICFALIGPSGAVAARSASYSVWLDCDAPDVQAQYDPQSGMLSVRATDALSGVDAISIDGGARWEPMAANAEGAHEYAAPLRAQIEAGDLMVRDAAGNLWRSAERYGAPGFGGMGGGFGGGYGGGGASSESERSVSHSSGDESTATAYGAVALELPEEDMYMLTLGGEALPLTLTLDCADGAARSAAFSAELAVWNGAAEDEERDTLILTAREEAARDGGVYRWELSGDVYKTLFNSGVRYLVLRVGDRVTALSTAGFTAGAAYNALKSAGAASSEFHYALRMGAAGPALEMEVEARGERYELRAGEGDMYYYDVYTGGMDMLGAAFGAEIQEGA